MDKQRFTHEGVEYVLDAEIWVKQIDPEYLILLQDFHFNNELIPAGFIYNGASSPSAPLARFIAPKFYKNIKASCVHDWLCAKARNAADRRKADKIYYLLKTYVELDSSMACVTSYIGVRIGALFGIGSSY